MQGRAIAKVNDIPAMRKALYGLNTRSMKDQLHGRGGGKTASKRQLIWNAEVRQTRLSAFGHKRTNSEHEKPRH